MECWLCKNELSDDEEVCPHCGIAQSENPDIVTEGSPDESSETATGNVADTQTANEPVAEVSEEPDAPKSLTVTASDEKSAETEPHGPDDEKKFKLTAKHLLIANIAVTALLVTLIVVGITTAEHWEKIDEPAKGPKTIQETYQTGYYTVTMDEVSPCYVGQSWTDCINTYIAEYNRECTKPMRSLWQKSAHYLGPRNQNLCERYGEMIQGMQEKGSGGYVSSLGSWGHLHSKPITDERTVANPNYVPAKTHEAVCYFGFLGECKEKEEKPVRQGSAEN